MTVYSIVDASITWSSDRNDHGDNWFLIAVSTMVEMVSWVGGVALLESMLRFPWMSSMEGRTSLRLS